MQAPVKTVAEWTAERDKIVSQIAAIKQLQITRVSNRNMFKREALETIIKGK